MENNVRLIDANALIKHYLCVEAQKSSAEKIRAEIIIQALENAPTIDPKSLQPVGRSDREKLIEMIQAAVDGCAEYWAGLIAGHLIAHGVTFAADTNVGSKWIPVTERLPEKDGSYLTFNKQNSVLLFTFFKDFGESGAYDLIGKKNIWCDYDSEYGYYECLDITHWMPLPEPPKGE